NDNPREEDPLKIISDIVVGLQKSNGKYSIEPDREKAIGLALDEARAGDMVLLAGKGHEDYQVLADRTLPWDDRGVAEQELRKRLAYWRRGRERELIPWAGWPASRLILAPFETANCLSPYTDRVMMDTIMWRVRCSAALWRLWWPRRKWGNFRM